MDAILFYVFAAIAVASVAGFPLGASVPEVKAAEAARAVEDGAREVDMVLSVGALKVATHRASRALRLALKTKDG